MAALINKREHERAGGIDGCEFDRLSFTCRRPLKLPRLHYRRMEIKIMRHHRGAENADADVKHPLIGHEFADLERIRREYR